MAIILVGLYMAYTVVFFTGSISIMLVDGISAGRMVMAVLHGTCLLILSGAILQGSHRVETGDGRPDDRRKGNRASRAMVPSHNGSRHQVGECRGTTRSWIPARCPICRLQVDSDSIACGTVDCRVRQHPACWQEAGVCGNCGGLEGV